MWLCALFFFFFQAEDGIRDLVRSRGLGDVYKRQPLNNAVGLYPNYVYLEWTPVENATQYHLQISYSLSLIHI